MNRALYQRSKRGIRRWYERTIFPFILRIPPEKLTSQAFWEHMEYLNEEAIERIEKELSSRIIELYDLNTECLLYDITNFYTFIQEHEGNELPKKGKSKAKRFDLNQINLALLVTKEDGIPLMHQTYEGNRHDAKKNRRRCCKMQKTIEVVFVYEKGVFKPLKKVEIPEGEKAKIMIEKEKGIITLEDIKGIKEAIKTLPNVRISPRKLDEMYYEGKMLD